MDPESELESVRREREARIAQLEGRLQRPRALGVRAPLAVAGMAVAVLLLWLQRSELAYLVSPRTPLILGRAGDYDFSKLASNRYAQIQGSPTARGTYFRDGARVGVVVGLRETPVLVARPALEGEEWKEGARPPQPDQRPFAVGGRLLSQADAGRFKDAFALHAQFGEITPRWVLVEGERPGEDSGTFLAAGLLVLLFLGNAYLLVRQLLSR